MTQCPSFLTCKIGIRVSQSYCDNAVTLACRAHKTIPSTESALSILAPVLILLRMGITIQNVHSWVVEDMS